MPQDYLTLGMFVIVGLLSTAAAVTASNLLSPSAPSAAKSATYECGSKPIGLPWVQFRVGYYVYALLFLAFDIETVFLFPWALAFGLMGMEVLWAMTIFVIILDIGLVYAWKEGAFEWR